jgi:FkbM family methyltransferase
VARGLTGYLQLASKLGVTRKTVGLINRGLLRLGSWRFRVEGQVLCASTLDRIAVVILHRFSSAERFELKLWRSLCRPGDVVLDVGSNLGLYAFIAAQQVGPEGCVWAFEADPVNSRLLQRGLEANGYSNVRVVTAAVTDHTGTATLFIREEHRGDIQIAYPGEDRTSISVPATTLDRALVDNPHVDMIKFDIQGAEVFAIAGMDKILRASPGLKIISEFWPQGIRRCGQDPIAFLKDWRELGFAISYIDEDKAALVPLPDDGQLLKLAERNRYINIFLERR